MNLLLKTAKALQEYCDEQNWRMCFIGGVAIQRWGEPRVTRDVDITLLTGFGHEEQFISRLMERFQPRRADAAEFALRSRVLLLVGEGGVGIDVSMGALPFEQSAVERATYYSFARGYKLRTCSAEDLIVMKLFASRPHDIRDAEGIAVKQATKIDWGYVEAQLTPLVELKEEPEILDTLRRIRKLA